VRRADAHENVLHIVQAQIAWGTGFVPRFDKGLDYIFGLVTKGDVMTLLCEPTTSCPADSSGTNHDYSHEISVGADFRCLVLLAVVVCLK
jgi:hypothetical protein